MDMSRLSTCSIPFRKQPVEEAFRIIAEAGFKKVDLLGAMPHLSLDPAEYDPAKTKAAAAARGLKIANLGTYVGKTFAGDDKAACEKDLADARRAIDLAVFFGARSIRVVPGDNKPEHIDKIAAWFRRAAEYAVEKKVFMGIENHGQPISGNPERCRELTGKVGSRFFGVLYEPANLMSAGVDYRAALDVMKDHIVHVHFKDVKRTPNGPERVMLGEGDIDFPDEIRRLAAIGYDGDIAVEFELKTVPAEQGLKDWFKAAQKWREA